MGEDEVKVRLANVEANQLKTARDIGEIKGDIGEIKGKLDMFISMQTPKPSSSADATALAVNTTNKTYSFLEKFLTVVGGALAGYLASKGVQ